MVDKLNIILRSRVLVLGENGRLLTTATLSTVKTAVIVQKSI